MNLNLKMTVERSKRRSCFLSLVFITKCLTKNLLFHKLFYSQKSGFRALHSTVKVGATNAEVVLECRQGYGNGVLFLG